MQEIKYKIYFNNNIIEFSEDQLIALSEMMSQQLIFSSNSLTRLALIIGNID